MIKNKLFYIVSIFLLALNLGIVAYFYHLKTGYHVDEIFSYGHANSSNGAFLIEGIDANFDLDSLNNLLFNRWIDVSVIHNYLTVQPEERFRYKHIFENMAVGVHPPLFYIMLHTVCSFTPDTFSKWQGAALNIPLWILLLFMMYKLSRRFFDDKYLALLPVVFYAYSQVGFNTVLFIRGYLLQTLWAVCLMYEAVCLLQEKDVTKKRWFLIFLFSLSGMLTQYNSIIYSAIIGIVIGFGLLLQKRYKHIMMLAAALILSLCSLFAVFPDAVNVLLDSSRAKEMVNISLSDKLMNFLDPLGKTKNLSSIYTTYLWSFREFNNYLLWVCIILPLSYKYLYTNADKSIDLLIIIYLLTCLYSEFFMPEMYIYNMRYVMLVVPLIAIATIWYLSFILQNLKIKNLYLKLFLCSVVFVNALFVDFENRSPYAFSENVYKKISLEGNVLVIVGESIFAYESINVLGNTDEVYMVMDSVPEEVVVREMNKANYVIKSNTDARFDMTIKPEKPAEIFSSTIDKVDFEKTIKVGERFYDIYHIRRKIFDE